MYPQHVTDTCSILGQNKLGNQGPLAQRSGAEKPHESQNAPLYPQSSSFNLQEGGRINFFVYFVQDCVCVVVIIPVSRGNTLINLRPSHPWYCSNYILQNGNMHTEQDTSSWRLSSKVFKSMEKVGHKLSFEILRGVFGWRSQKPQQRGLVFWPRLNFILAIN